MMEKIEGRRRREQQRVRWLNDIIDSMDMDLSKLRETVKDSEAWCVVCSTRGHKKAGHDLVTKQEQDQN